MNERITVIVPRDKWMRGKDSFLLDPESGCRCINGHVCAAVNVDDKLIVNDGYIDDEVYELYPSLRPLTEHFIGKDSLEAAANSLNDDRGVADDIREARIVDLYEEAGFDVEFVDGAPT